MDWFRLYAEFSTDPKVQMMTEGMQRRLVMLMCFTCQSGNVSETFHETEVETSLAFFMRVSAEELRETKTIFIARGFIDDAWSLCNWSKRQFRSDSSTARVRDFRSRQKGDVTFRAVSSQRCSNAPEQNRTEQIREKEKISPKGDLLAGIDAQIASDFRALRTKLKAPITATAMTGIKREAEKAGIGMQDALAICCERGWRSFKADWNHGVNGTKSGTAESVPDFMRGAI